MSKSKDPCAECKHPPGSNDGSAWWCQKCTRTERRKREKMERLIVGWSEGKVWTPELRAEAVRIAKRRAE